MENNSRIKCQLNKKYQIVLMNMFKSRLFDEYPTDDEMKEYVASIFPTFHVDGDRVTWKVETIYFIED